MKNQAFTLIELLVVVLIIGILAAIAVPQYQIAVAKSNVSKMFALGKSLSNAQRIYYLTNDKYTKNVEDLDISLPNTCSPLTEIEDEQHTWFACDKDFTLDNDTRGTIRINYCPGFNSGIVLCEQNRILQLNFYFKDDYMYKLTNCVSTNNSSLGEKICSGLAITNMN